MVIGDGCRLDPFSLAGPGLTLLKGGQLPALSTKPRKAALGRKVKGPAAAAQQSPLMAEAMTPIESPAVTATAHSLMQVSKPIKPPHLKFSNLKASGGSLYKLVKSSVMVEKSCPAPLFVLCTAEEGSYTSTQCRSAA